MLQSPPLNGIRPRIPRVETSKTNIPVKNGNHLSFTKHGLVVLLTQITLLLLLSSFMDHLRLESQLSPTFDQAQGSPIWFPAQYKFGNIYLFESQPISRIDSAISRLLTHFLSQILINLCASHYSDHCERRTCPTISSFRSCHPRHSLSSRQKSDIHYCVVPATSPLIILTNASSHTTYQANPNYHRTSPVEYSTASLICFPGSPHTH